MTKKILRVISSVNPVGGGPVEAAIQQSHVLEDLGVHVTFASCDDPSAPWVKSFPFEIHALGPSCLRYSYTPRLLAWLNANTRHFDAIVVQGIWQYHAFAVWRSHMQTGHPYFVFPHGMLDPWFKRAYPLKHVKKMIYWLLIEHRVLRDAVGVIFTCEEERLRSQESFRPYSVKEIVSPYGTASPPPVNSSYASLVAANFPETLGKRLILFLGRIHEKKGCDLLLEAFAQVAATNPDLHLIMAGPDQNGWARTLQQLAAQLGIKDRITWPGMVQGDLKWALFYSCDVFCLPSHQENFGVAVAEALACGKPVLISNKVNIWREIEAAGAGFVADDTVEGTTKNLRQWLELPPEVRRDMGLRAKECFNSHFHVRRAAEKLLAILTDIGPKHSNFERN